MIIVSPAKKLDFETEVNCTSSDLPVYIDQSKVLVNNLKKLSAADISKLMKISPKLGELNYQRYKSFKVPLDLSQTKASIYAFRGDTYVGLDVDSFNRENLKIAQKKLRILSGLYGVLRPLDQILPYRLEMGTNFKFANYKNLYDYWRDSITDCLITDIKKSKSEFLLNCASNEYSSVVDFSKIPVPVVTPVFKEYKDGQFKMISIFAKRARGLMSRFAIMNNISKIDDIKKFNLDGYQYNDELSSDLSPVFTRKAAK